MRTLALLVVLTAALVAQQPDEAYPGQSEHREPPPGWMCHRPPVDLSGDQAKWCGCERVVDQDGVVHADKECATWCWEAQHCECPTTGDKRYMPPKGQ